MTKKSRFHSISLFTSHDMYFLSVILPDPQSYAQVSGNFAAGADVFFGNHINY